MTNPKWKIESLYPEKNQLYKKPQQLAMESWLDTTQIMTMLTQAQDNQKIHPKECEKC